MNPAYERMYGKRRDEVIGKTLTQLVPAPLRQERRALVERALAGEAAELLTTGFRGDGTPFDLEVRVIPFRHRGEPHVLGIARDITGRKKAEEAMRASEEQYRAIFNASADALVLRDADFRIVDVNATYERMSGWTRDEVLGMDRVVANPAEVAPTIRALHERALAGELIALEVPLVRRDGTRYELELRGVPIQHRGQPHVLYMGRDVTERKRAEEALRASEEQYRAIFNASADALVLWDKQYRRVDVNPAYQSDVRLGARGSDRQGLRRPALSRGVRENTPGPRAACAGRRGLPGGARGDSQRRHAHPDGGACDPVSPPRRAARARDCARHHRAEAVRGSVARQRGAVPRDLQCLGRCDAAARRYDDDRRRQSRLPRAVRTPAVTGRRQDGTRRS